MFFSKAVFIAISLAAISVLATPHALNHADLHHRAIATRVASPQNQNLPKRQNNQRCKKRSTSIQMPTPTSAAPTTTSHVQEQPTTTPPVRVISPATLVQQRPPTTTTTAPGVVNTGDITYFQTGLGACGQTNTDDQYICAISHLRFNTYPGYDGTNPNHNPVCNKKINITHQGKTITVTVMDSCEACDYNHLDLTPGAFSALQPTPVGIFKAEWYWV